MDTTGKIVVVAGLTGFAFLFGVGFGIGIAEESKSSNPTSTKAFAATRKRDRDSKIVLDAMLEQMSAEQQAAAWRVVNIRTNFADIVSKL